MRSQIAGLRDGIDWPQVGDEIDVPDDEGAELCANGTAEPVVKDKTEKAVSSKRAEKRG
jgi:hypothetical protein